MTGAVFLHEMLLAGRRQRTHFLRWAYLALLVMQLLSTLASATLESRRSGAIYRDFFGTFLWQHFALLLVATPALAAGAVSDEKARGTLEHLLTADLRPLDVVLGKLLGRAYGLVVLSLVGLPVVCYFGVLANFDVSLPLAFVAVSALLVLGAGAVSLLASVWCRHTRDAVLCTYLFGIGVFTARRFLATTRWAGLIDVFDPWQALTLDDAAQDWHRLGQFAAAWLAVGVACLSVAAWRLRPAYLKQCRPPRARRRWWQASRPRVRGNPVAWRERLVLGFAPLDALRTFPRWAGMLVVMLATAGTMIYWVLQHAPPATGAWRLFWAGDLEPLRGVLSGTPHTTMAVRLHGLGALLVLMLVVAVRAAGTITEEREHGTWTDLLLTPLSTRTIIRGKLWGVVWACAPYLAAHAAVALPLAWFVSAEALLWQAMLVLVGPAALVYVTAVGLWSSAQALSTWRSLLRTLVMCYLTWLASLVVLGCAGAAVIGALDFFFHGLNLFVDVGNPLDDFAFDHLLYAAAVLVACWMLTHGLLTATVEHVEGNERTKVVKGPYSYVYQGLARRLEENAAEEYRQKVARDDHTIPLAGDEQPV